MSTDSAAALPRPEQPAPRTAEELAAYLGVALPTSAAGLRITGVAQGSRQVRPGDLFVARAGARTHGADFAAAAVAAGAVLAVTDPAGAERCRAAGLPTLVVDEAAAVLGRLASWVYADPAEHLGLFGVTGTNGKTTVTYLLDVGLRAVGRRTGVVGTVETRVADRAVPSRRSTPEAPELHGLFAAMREAAVDTVSMEVSSQAILLGRVDGVRFDVAGFTNLSQDHLDVHGDLESYFQAKAALFTPERAKVAVINVDDRHGARLAGSTLLEVVRVSASGAEGADWWPEEIRGGATGTTFLACGPSGLRVPVEVGMPGEFNVENALLALAMLHRAGVDARTAAAAFARAVVPGRMERFGDAGLDVVVDYAHTPEGITTVLASTRPSVAGRQIAVLGCGGDRDAGKRPLMGAAAARGADVVVLTDDNPRSEEPAVIRAAALAGAEEVPSGERGEVVEVAGRREAIRYAVRLARPGDLVLVLGRGHEQGQEIDGVMYPFDDRSVVREVLSEVVSS